MATAESAVPVLPALLQGYLDQLAFIRRETAELTGGITDAQFNWAPAPERWSAAQVVNHLTLVDGDYTDRIARVLADGRARGLRDRGDYKPSLLGGMMVRSMEPPPRRRFKAPRQWHPTDFKVAADPAAELARLNELHDRIEALIREAAGLDLRRIRLASPVSRLIRMNVGDAFALILTHERRHLYQLRKVTEEPGYPKG